MGGRWKIPVILSTLREQWVWLHLRPNVQVINSRQCANSSCCISARTCEYVLNTIYSNNIFIGTSSYRISLARCCGGYLLSLSAMLWTAISSAVAAAAAAVLEMLSLAMFPIATLGIFEFPPKKVLDQNISNPFEFKQIPGCCELACGKTRPFLFWHKEATEEAFSWSTCPPQPSQMQWLEWLDATCWWALGSRLAKRRSNIWEGTWTLNIAVAQPGCPWFPNHFNSFQPNDYYIIYIIYYTLYIIYNDLHFGPIVHGTAFLSCWWRGH